MTTEKHIIRTVRVQAGVRSGHVGLTLRLVTQNELPPSFAGVNGSNNQDILDLKPGHSV